MQMVNLYPTQHTYTPTEILDTLFQFETHVFCHFIIFTYEWKLYYIENIIHLYSNW